MLQMIFQPTDNRYPTVEELVLCDLFRNIDLREMRGPSISVSFSKAFNVFISKKEEEKKQIKNIIKILHLFSSFYSLLNMD